MYPMGRCRNCLLPSGSRWTASGFPTEVMRPSRCAMFRFQLGAASASASSAQAARANQHSWTCSSSSTSPRAGRSRSMASPAADAANTAWRSLFGVVPQEAFLFSATVGENIRFGDDALTDQQVRDAADAALVGAFLDDLPNGLDTHVGDRGVRLSGGQRQRVAIARALANHRQILIFDEATSALDSVSERQVQQAIDALPGELTVLIIAHRLSTIANCGPRPRHGSRPNRRAGHAPRSRCDGRCVPHLEPGARDRLAGWG